jgi:two-component system, chemotaxis family, response regulator Rcp1
MSAKLIEILLFENNPADIRLAQETLKDYKLQNSLHILRDGDAALRFLRREREFQNAPVPDLVMLDLSLPKVDGIEVLRHIRRDENLKDLPVVILTASAIDERLLEEYNVAVDCAVLKPLTLERYLEAIRCFPNLGISIVKIATA